MELHGVLGARLHLEERTSTLHLIHLEVSLHGSRRSVSREKSNKVARGLGVHDIENTAKASIVDAKIVGAVALNENNLSDAVREHGALLVELEQNIVTGGCTARNRASSNNVVHGVGDRELRLNKGSNEAGRGALDLRLEVLEAMGRRVQSIATRVDRSSSRAQLRVRENDQDFGMLRNSSAKDSGDITAVKKILGGSVRIIVHGKMCFAAPKEKWDGRGSRGVRRSQRGQHQHTQCGKDK